MDFNLTEDQQAFRDTARQFATEAHAARGRPLGRREDLPVETLREAAALGFGGIYVKEDVGGSGLSRMDCGADHGRAAAACPSTAAYISIHNMSAWMIDGFGDRRAAPTLPAQALLDGAFRQLLPHRTGAGSDRGGSRHARRTARRFITS